MINFACLVKSVFIFNRGSRSRKTKILTTGIYLIFRGLKFESDAEIGRNGSFFKGLVTKPLYWAIILAN